MKIFYIFFLALCFFQVGIYPASAEKSEAESVPGDLIILFKPNAMILMFGSDVPDDVLNAMIDFQAKYLVRKYGVAIKGTFPEISRSNGKGMFHIHSEKAAKSNSAFEIMKMKLSDDPNIESVSENARTGISTFNRVKTE